MGTGENTGENTGMNTGVSSRPASGGEFVPSQNTIFYINENDFTVDELVPDPVTNYPYYMLPSYVNERPTTRNAIATPFGSGVNYVEYTIPANNNAAITQVRGNPGNHPAIQGSGLPHTITLGQRYFCCFTCRMERIGGLDIWEEGASLQSSNKHFTITGQAIRWGLSYGQGPNHDAQFAHVPPANPDGTFNYWVGNPTYQLNQNPPDEVLGQNNYPNLAGYDIWNDIVPVLQYETWYRFIFALTLDTTSGRAEVWEDGVKVLDRSDGITVDPGSGPPFTIDYIDLLGTIKQPQYNAPEHKYQFMRLLITTDWNDVVNAGYT